MAAFADFIDLQTAVVEHVGTSTIADVFPRLVQLAEVNFNRRLRCRNMVTTAVVTITAGVGALPADFIAAIGVYNVAGFEYVQQPLQAVKTTDTTQFYAISGGNIVTKIAAATVSLEYYAKVPTLAGVFTTTNWLLLKHPGLYLYAVGLEAAKYIRDLELAKVTAELAEMEYQAVAAIDQDERYSRARVRVAGVTP